MEKLDDTGISNDQYPREQGKLSKLELTPVKENSQSSKQTNSETKPLRLTSKRKYELGRVHVYQEEKSRTYRVFFFLDKQRCLGSFANHDQADLALGILRTKLHEEIFNDKESIDELVAYIRNTVRGGNCNGGKKRSIPANTEPKQTMIDHKVEDNASNVEMKDNARTDGKEDESGTIDDTNHIVATKLEWSKVEECKLLLIALDNPSHVLDHGFPSVQETDEYNEIDARNHWNEMLERYHHSKSSSSNILSKTPSNERASHILQVCMVLSYEEKRQLEAQQIEYEQSQQVQTKMNSKKYKERMEHINHVRNSVTTEAIAALKSNVLLSCGWRILPFHLVYKRGNKVDPFRNSSWHRPGVTLKVTSILSEKEFVKSSMSINDAWDLHLQELRSDIESDIPKSQSMPPSPPVIAQEESFVVIEPAKVEPVAAQEDRYEVDATSTPSKDKKAAKKVRKEPKHKIDPAIVPKHVQNMMAARARFVSEGDPRPSMQCTWCGPKQWSRKVHKQQTKDGKVADVAPIPTSGSPPAHVICKGCQLLYKDGWRMDDTSSNSNTFLSSTANNRRWADYVFRNKDKGISLRSVKTFLLQTSPYVSDIISNDPTVLETMEDTMVIPKLKKDRGSNASGDGTITSSTRGRAIKRRKIAEDEDSSEDEQSIDSSSSSSSTSSSSNEEENHDEENNEENRDEENDTADNHVNQYDAKSAPAVSNNSNNAIVSSAIDDIVMLSAILSTIPRNVSQTTSSQTNVKLPTIYDLLKEEYGLSGILQSDEYGILNVHFGNDAEIICQVLAPLTTGKLPRIIYKESPLLRSKEELDYLHKEGGPPPARFMGVTRIFERTNVHSSEKGSSSTIGPNGKFGVEIPLLFYKGRKVILRDFDREDVSGILFAFLYRLLFGSRALQDMSKAVNDKYERKEFIMDTLYAFGAISDDKMDTSTADVTTRNDMVIDNKEHTING